MKKIITSIIVSLLVLGSIIGGIFYYKHKKDADTYVKVYSLEMMAYPNYEGAQTSSGYTYKNNNQNIYIDSTKNISEVCCTPGDAVKVGDTILKYDVKQLEVQKQSLAADLELARYDLRMANKALDKLNNTTPVPDTYQEDQQKKIEEAKNNYYSKLGSALGMSVSDENREEAEEKFREFTPMEEPKATDTDAQNKKKQHDDIVNQVSTALSDYEKLLVPDEPSGDDKEPVYTETELKFAKEKARNTIEAKNLAVRNAELALEKQENSINESEVKASINGKVQKVDVSKDNLNNGNAAVVISADGSVGVTASISEWDLAKIKVGSTVSCYSYSTSMTYTGTVTEILDTPLSDDYYGGNDSASLYPVKIQLDDASDLAEGEYLEISIDANADFSMDSSGTTEFVIPLCFVKNENGTYYAYVEEKGKIKKKPVITGAIMYGQEIVIKKGLSMSDKVAFAYSSKTKEGLKTKDGSFEDLY